MQKRMPDYQSDRKLQTRFDPYSLIYSKPFRERRRIFVSFSVGSMGLYRITPDLGLYNPHYISRLSNFLSMKEDTWRVRSLEDCEPVANEIIDVLQEVMPIFASKIEEAFEEFEASGAEWPPDQE
jgi:hypothetical protein